VHRIGRAGRFGGHGLAINFITSSDSESQTENIDEVTSINACSLVKKYLLTIEDNDRVTTRLSKEQLLLTNRETDKKDIEVKESVYKRRKLLSKESMIGQW